MDRAPVTNAHFERFVKATGYVTVAERPLDPRDFPGVPRDKLVPGSAVFVPTSSPVPADSFDPQEPGAAKRVLRGGSYLCTDQYCARYLVGSRGKSEVTSGTSNLGFRLVQSVSQ